MYSDSVPADLGDHINNGICVVLKTHAPHADLLTLTKLSEAPVVLTVRDPRDCLVSHKDAFNLSQSETIDRLAESAEALLQLDQNPRQLLIKYEESAASSESVHKLARLLGLDPQPGLVAEVYNALSIDNVQAKIAVWEADGTLDKGRASESFTEESHWHPNHCSDGEIGKFRAKLLTSESALVSKRLKQFMATFGYTPDEPPALAAGDVALLSGDGWAYVDGGFSPPEPWGAWTILPEARLFLPLAGNASQVHVELSMILGPSFGLPTLSAEININGKHIVDLHETFDEQGLGMLVYDGPCQGDQVIIEFRFSGLMSPQKLGYSSDERLLGLGLKRVKLSYTL
ncbi:MAG: sulfotransferase domain-containing protein [Pseudomonadota bacterium]